MRLRLFYGCSFHRTILLKKLTLFSSVFFCCHYNEFAIFELHETLLSHVIGDILGDFVICEVENTFNFS